MNEKQKNMLQSLERAIGKPLTEVQKENLNRFDKQFKEELELSWKIAQDVAEHEGRTANRIRLLQDLEIHARLNTFASTRLNASEGYAGTRRALEYTERRILTACERLCEEEKKKVDR